MLLRTLLFLRVVGLDRTWDLRSYTGDGLGVLTGRPRAYGYFHTERFLDALIPRGLIGNSGKILGCRALVLLHEEQGHPRLATIHRGDQHLTVGLPAMLGRYEQAAGKAPRTQIIVDREGMASSSAK
jgi:hypothetical protein